MAKYQSRHSRIYSRKKERSGGRSFVLLLVVLLLLMAVCAAGYWFFLRPLTTEIKGLGPDDYAVTGLSKVWNPEYGEDITDTITITPGAGRTVRIQKMDPATNEWKTMQTITTEKAKDFLHARDVSTELSITIPAKDYGKKASSWRLKVDAEFLQGGSLVTETYQVIPYNTGKDPKVTSESAAVIRVSDGLLVYGKNPYEELPNASTTKLMTSLISMEGRTGDEEVVMSKEAASTEYGDLWAHEGDIFLMKDLWNALLIASSNDAAAGIAEACAGSQEAFADEMNKKAEELGLKHTHFVNPHGLDADGHYSCTYDLVQMARANWDDQRFRKILLMDKCKLNPTNDIHRINTLYTTNKLLEEEIPGHLGAKTGYTTNAKACIVTLYEYDGEVYATAVLKSTDRWNDSKKLYAYIRSVA